MERRVNLKPFYLLLGVLALGGAGWIWMSRASGPTTITLPTGAGTPAYEGYALGSDSAPVTIVEYADFQCPACATFAILTADEVRRRLVNTGRVRWLFRDFPLPIHDKAPLAHHAAACAAEQGRFWEMHDQLFFNQGRWAGDRQAGRRFQEFARAIGLDAAAYERCMTEERYAARIAATREAGAGLGVSSTPTFIVGDQMVSGALGFEALVRLVEQAEARRAR